MKTDPDYILKRIALLMIVLCSVNALAKGNTKLKVTVIENVPTTYLYNWQVPGRATVSCDSSSCSSYYMPPSSGTSNIRGAILKLLMPDGRIVIASCAAKGDVAMSMLNAIATNNPNAPTVLRNCRIPEANSTIDAEFTRSQVKLFMQAPSIDGTGRISSETYFINGVLQPTASSQVASQIAANPELKAQMDANIKASLTSQAEAASLMNGEPVWSSMTPAERAQTLKDGQASRCVISTNPTGAEIDVDGNRAGISPLTFALMRHGNDYRTITIKMTGYVPVEKKFLPDGKTIPIGITLEPEYVPVEKKFLPDGKTIPIGITLEPEPATQVQKLVPPGLGLTPVEQSSTNKSSNYSNLKTVNEKIAALVFPAQELLDQRAMFQKQCPDPTTDESCLAAKRQVILAMSKNLESRILLFDEKISLLDAGPQDLMAQTEEDESVKKREDLKTVLRGLPETLANLDKSLAGIKQAQGGR